MKPLQAGQKVTVWGLGLHGGGLAAAQYALSCGADLTITDLRDETVLAPSLKQLEGKSFRLVLGRHEDRDFTNADIVIKNPAIKRNNRLIGLAPTIETDISLFLQGAKGKVIGITGTKGKSSTASALAHSLVALGQRCFLGGNITTSPLTFIDELDEGSYTVLELSSFQLGDLRLCSSIGGRGLVADPQWTIALDGAITTTMMHDHLDYYGSMEPYVADKALLGSLSYGGSQVYHGDHPWAGTLLKNAHGKKWLVGETLETLGNKAICLAYQDGPLIHWPENPIWNGKRLWRNELGVPGHHSKLNIAAVGALLIDLLPQTDPQKLSTALTSYKGIAHRFEPVARIHGRTWINDSAATVPQAAEEAVAALATAPLLIAGGADKGLDLKPLIRACEHSKNFFLLAGTGTDRLVPLIRERENFAGVYDSLKEAMEAAYQRSDRGDTILLSPGCSSFGMFLHEFDRGNQFRSLAMDLAKRTPVE